MKRILLLILLCSVFAQKGFSQTKDEIKQAIKEAIIEANKEIEESNKSDFPKKVDQLTFNNDTIGKKHTIVSDEVKDFYRVTTYFDERDNLKVYKVKITPDEPYESASIQLVTSTEYNDDRFKQIVKAEIKDAHYVITYITNHILKVAYLPITKGYISTIDNKWFTFSLLTVPFKIRPSINGKPSYSKADIDNVGVFTGIYNISYERWFADDSKSEYKMSFGFYIAPTVEELNSSNSTLIGDDSANQVYLTTALTAVFSLKKINFAIIPIGIDSGFSPTSKKWDYNGKIWWGFGVGIDTSVFGW